MLNYIFEDDSINYLNFAFLLKIQKLFIYSSKEAYYDYKVWRWNFKMALKKDKNTFLSYLFCNNKSKY